jgi:hypothetical protein
MTDVKRICRYLPLAILLVAYLQPGQAQSTIDVQLGFGSPQDSANAGFDTSIGASGNPTSTFGLICSSASVTCAQTPKLGGFMLGFGANAMLWKKYGIGGEVNFQAPKQTYANATSAGQGIIQSRITFYDFNGILQPINKEKVTLQIMGGIGGANFRLYQNFTGGTGSLLGNSVYANYPIGSANHFQIHGGVGVQIYVSGNFFIRPQFDVHYVPNFIQYGHNLATSATAWVGYSFGERQ